MLMERKRKAPDTLTALRREVKEADALALRYKAQRDDVIDWLAKCENELERETAKRVWLESEVVRLKKLTDRLCGQLQREQAAALERRQADPEPSGGREE